MATGVGAPRAAVAWLAGAIVLLAAGAPAQAEEAPPAGEPPGPTAHGPSSEEQEADAEGPSWLAFPVISYTPATHVLLGATGLTTFDLRSAEPEDQRSSYFRALAAGSLRKQWIADFASELWTAGNLYRIWVRFHVRDWPSKFFGLGNDTSPGAAEPFRTRAYEGELEGFRALGQDVYFGLVSRFAWVDVLETSPTGQLLSDDLPGTEGSVLRGWGGALTYDSRDNTVYPTRGGRYELRIMGYNLAASHGTRYAHVLADARHFFHLGRRHIVAAHAALESTKGDVPFTELPWLGGRDRMRGYFQGRFRDKNMVLGQLEYRFPLVWRFSGALFGSTGQVFGSGQKFEMTRFHWSAGGGLRVRATDGGANLRIDVGFTEDSWGIYFMALEAF